MQAFFQLAQAQAQNPLVSLIPIFLVFGIFYFLLLARSAHPSRGRDRPSFGRAASRSSRAAAHRPGPGKRLR